MAEPEIEVGHAVKCTLPGRRSFVSFVVAIREAEMSVDVSDPRNGGLRTLSLDFVRPVKGAREKRAAEASVATIRAIKSKGVRKK